VAFTFRALTNRFSVKDSKTTDPKIQRIHKEINYGNVYLRNGFINNLSEKSVTFIPVMRTIDKELKTPDRRGLDVLLDLMATKELNLSEPQKADIIKKINTYKHEYPESPPSI